MGTSQGHDNCNKACTLFSGVVMCVVDHTLGFESYYTYPRTKYHIQSTLNIVFSVMWHSMLCYGNFSNDTLYK
jgi:hypothetical protein